MRGERQAVARACRDDMAFQIAASASTAAAMRTAHVPPGDECGPPNAAAAQHAHGAAGIVAPPSAAIQEYGARSRLMPSSSAKVFGPPRENAGDRT